MTPNAILSPSQPPIESFTRTLPEEGILRRQKTVTVTYNRRLRAFHYHVRVARVSVFPRTVPRLA